MCNAFSVNLLISFSFPGCAAFAATLGFGVKRLRRNSHRDFNYVNAHEVRVELVRERRRITPEIAWLLGGALGTTAEFWTNLQSNYDLAISRPKKRIGRLQRAS
jgi:hypothetical protein